MSEGQGAEAAARAARRAALKPYRKFSHAGVGTKNGWRGHLSGHFRALRCAVPLDA